MVSDHISVIRLF